MPFCFSNDITTCDVVNFGLNSFYMDIIHVLNRGVDKRDIFLDDQDRFRFIHDLFEFNNQERVNNNFYVFNKSNDIASRYIKEPRKKLVDVHIFCLMNNHYHLLLSSRIESGIPKFMRKLNMGYAKYFNEKYKRTGALFEGRYKSVPVKREAHFLYVPYYIHLNPLDFISPEWRERRLKNPKKASEFLKTYRWSSHLDYAGIKNFPSVIEKSFFYKFFGGSDKYEKSIRQWLKDIDIEKTEDSKKIFALE